MDIKQHQKERTRKQGRNRRLTDSFLLLLNLVLYLWYTQNASLAGVCERMEPAHAVQKPHITPFVLLWQCAKTFWILNLQVGGISIPPGVPPNAPTDTDDPPIQTSPHHTWPPPTGPPSFAHASACRFFHM